MPGTRTGLLLLAFVFVFALENLSAQSFSPVIYDKNQSQYFGAVNILFAHKALHNFTDSIIPRKFTEENTTGRKVVGFGYRMSNLLLNDFQIDYLFSLLQHEVFGHGARYREFGHESNSYSLNLFFPYGKGGGFARSGPVKENETIGRDESIAKILAGSEANLVLSGLLEDKFFLEGKMHYRDGLLFLISKNDLLTYIWVTRLRDNDGSSNDITSYINSINGKYFEYSQYSIEKLSGQSLVSVLNPYQLISFFTLLYTYGINAETETAKIPMINIGRYRFMPLVNYSFTPFGIQYGFRLYLKSPSRNYSAEVEIGDKLVNRFYAIGLKAFDLFKNDHVSLGVIGKYWHQPDLSLESNEPVSLFSNKTGGMLKLDLFFHPMKNKNMAGLYLQAGYKMKGYSLGEELDKGMILKLGISIRN